MGAVLFSCPAVSSPCPSPRLSPQPLKGPATRGPYRRPGPADKRTRAAAHIKGPAELPFPHPPSGADRTQGIREASPKTADKSRTISGHGPLPRHSIRSGQKTGSSGKGRKRRGREGKEGGGKKRGGEAKKPEGREKPGNRKAGKQKSREASEGTKRHKKNGGAPSGAPPPAALSGALRIGITCCGKSSCSRR